jgi:hypothetical protein
MTGWVNLNANTIIMKFWKLFVSVMVFLLIGQVMQGQVLISLLFGDKLNSPTLKFGLDGGANFSTISNNSGSKYHTGFNLGFYFDFLLKKDKPWYIHTGVLVKSPMGVDNLSPYHLSNPDSAYLDTLFANGSVERQFRYFNVPVLVRYKFKNNLFLELGPMLGLMYKATDVFTTKVENDKDLSYQNKVISQYKKFDIGGMAGIGYHIDYLNGMNFGLRYYYGFMDIVKNNTGPAQRNSSFYLFASIPIGAGEKAQAKQAAKKKEELEKQEKKLKEEQLEKEKK